MWNVVVAAHGFIAVGTQFRLQDVGKHLNVEASRTVAFVYQGIYVASVV